MDNWVTSSPVKVGQKLEEKVEERLNDGEEPVRVDIETLTKAAKAMDADSVSEHQSFLQEKEDDENQNSE